MRRVVARLALLTIAILIGAHPIAALAVIPGPTPTGTGSFAYCNTNIKRDQLDQQISLNCTYGIPATGVTLTRFEMHVAEQGWVPFTNVGNPSNHSGCGNDGVTFNGTGELVGRMCAYNRPTPDAIRAVFSDGTNRPASQVITHCACNTWPAQPEYGFRSGITGEQAPPIGLTTEDAALDGFDLARSQLPDWMNQGTVVVTACVLLACGGGIVVAQLRKAAPEASTGGSWSIADDGGTFGSIQGDDDGGDDSGDDDLGLNSSDDHSDDDGEETDDGSDAGGIGLGDFDVCVSCGADLEFGWDYDECSECGGV